MWSNFNERMTTFGLNSLFSFKYDGLIRLSVCRRWCMQKMINEKAAYWFKDGIMNGLIEANLINTILENSSVPAINYNGGSTKNWGEHCETSPASITGKLLSSIHFSLETRKSWIISKYFKMRGTSKYT